MAKLRLVAMFITLLSFSLCEAQAAKIYKRIPFNTPLTQQDELIVNYDFSGKKGIFCAAENDHFTLEYIYRGHQKTTRLPVILQSAKVPNPEQDKMHEELADLNGQFSLKLAHSSKARMVYCDYADEL